MPFSSSLTPRASGLPHHVRHVAPLRSWRATHRRLVGGLEAVSGSYRLVATSSPVSAIR